MSDIDAVLNRIKGNLIRRAQKAAYDADHAGDAAFYTGRQRAFEEAIGDIDFEQRLLRGRASPEHPKTKEALYRPSPGNFEDRLA